jgi:hypothetical protein
MKPAEEVRWTKRRIAEKCIEISSHTLLEMGHKLGHGKLNEPRLEILLAANVRTVNCSGAPHTKAFIESLLARKKARLQALIAVARKLLHVIFGIFRSGLKYEGTKLFPKITLS